MREKEQWYRMKDKDEARGKADWSGGDVLERNERKDEWKGRKGKWWGGGGGVLRRLRYDGGGGGVKIEDCVEWSLETFENLNQ
jgi:hypothetical protein